MCSISICFPLKRINDGRCHELLRGLSLWPYWGLSVWYLRRKNEITNKNPIHSLRHAIMPWKKKKKSVRRIWTEGGEEEVAWAGMAEIRYNLCQCTAKACKSLLRPYVSWWLRTPTGTDLNLYKLDTPPQKPHQKCRHRQNKWRVYSYLFTRTY